MRGGVWRAQPLIGRTAETGIASDGGTGAWARFRSSSRKLREGSYYPHWLLEPRSRSERAARRSPPTSSASHRSPPRAPFGSSRSIGSANVAWQAASVAVLAAGDAVVVGGRPPVVGFMLYVKPSVARLAVRLGLGGAAGTCSAHRSACSSTSRLLAAARTVMR